jgi:AraC-like DNA-binding protein
VCSRQCQSALDTLKEKDQLVRTLKQYIAAQDATFPKLEDSAKEFGYNSRALRRKLESLNCSFSSLVTEVKTEQAQLLLQKPDLSISEISELLGYTEVTNFRRAYRSWTGKSPSGYRRGLSL